MNKMPVWLTARDVVSLLKPWSWSRDLRLGLTFCSWSWWVRTILVLDLKFHRRKLIHVMITRYQGRLSLFTIGDKCAKDNLEGI